MAFKDGQERQAASKKLLAMSSASDADIEATAQLINDHPELVLKAVYVRFTGFRWTNSALATAIHSLAFLGGAWTSEQEQG